MAAKNQRNLSATVLAVSTLGILGCEEVGDHIETLSLPKCSSERDVSGWTVTTALDKDSTGEFLISKWEVSRNFDAFFGIRIAYDTSYSPIPYLKVWHDYKSGNFAIRFPDGAQLVTPLDADYAISTVRLRSQDADTLAAQPVRIEHTSHTGKWNAYQTEGLPEAMSATKQDLEITTKSFDEGNCKA